jgi:hypothetical protein
MYGSKVHIQFERIFDTLLVHFSTRKFFFMKTTSTFVYNSIFLTI